MDNIQIIDSNWLIFITRFLLNLLVVTVIARFFYLRRGKGSREYVFTYISVSTVVFLICILVSKVEVQLGIAIGLFAVFSIIRFRSLSATPRDLAYLFISLGFGLIMALLPLDTPILRTLLNYTIFVTSIGLMEYLVFQQKQSTKIVIYDRPELLASGNQDALKTDLEERYGLRGIERIQIGDIDSLKNKVKLKLHLRDPDQGHFEE